MIETLTALAGLVERTNHDARGALSPALLTADRLTRHADPAVRAAAEDIAKAIEKAAATLQESSRAARAARDGHG